MSDTSIRTYTSARQRTDAEETEESRTETDVCPECGGTLRTDEEHGETVCADCGLVVEENEIDRGPEHDKGLSTNIGWQDKDAYGNSLSSRQRQKMQRLRTWNERFRTRNSKERNLKQALGEIERMSSALGLPKEVRETASVIYRRALNEDLLPGRSIEGVATAALYAAARQMQTPRSIDEVATVSRIDDMEFKRTYRYIVRELSLEVAPADPASYVPRFASELDLSDEVERQARDLLNTAAEKGVTSGKSPVGLAAAAIYAASLLTNQKVTQSEVSGVTDVSEVTIRNRYQELLEAAETLD